MRTPMIAGNWKMFKTNPEARAMVEELKQLIKDVRGIDVVIAPPYTALAAVNSILSGSTIKLAAQNLFWEAEGAYTGEISPRMLKDSGCQMVIIGHSERRQFFAETDESVFKKIGGALRNQLLPIVCIGETLKQREESETFQVVTKQLDGGLFGLTAQEMESITIAYEPVWAIGTGKNATPAQANEVHEYIRKQLKEKYGETLAGRIRVLYGGSVKPDNIKALMAEPEIDGVLVGGASLEAKSFANIIKYNQ